MSADQPRMQYVDTSAGQLHVRSWSAPESDLPTAVCLHPVPYSGRYYHTFASHLRKHCHVLAVDLPGFGGSAPTAEPISITEHASAVGEALEQLGAEQDSPRFMPIGFHTGSGVGGELAVIRPDLVSHVTFVTYPYLEPAARQKELETWASPPPLPSTLDDLTSRWNFTVGGRAEGVAMENAFDFFAEQLRSADRFWHGFVAMFRYPAEERLGDIKQPVLVINPPDGLHSMTTGAIGLLNDPKVFEPDYGQKAIFELFPDRLADVISRFAAE